MSGQPSKTLAYVGIGIGVLALVVAALALALPSFQVPAPATTTRTFLVSSDLLSQSNRYHPDTLHAFAGDNIVFNVTNRGTAQHGFTVEGLNIAGTIEPGETKSFTATAVPAGLYRYYCHLHSAHIGGQLVVLSR